MVLLNMNPLLRVTNFQLCRLGRLFQNIRQVDTSPNVRRLLPPLVPLILLLVIVIVDEAVDEAAAAEAEVVVAILFRRVNMFQKT